MEDYLNTFRNITAEDFADDFDDLEAEDKLHKKLIIKGKNMPGSFEITCFADAARRATETLRSEINTYRKGK